MDIRKLFHRHDADMDDAEIAEGPVFADSPAGSRRVGPPHKRVPPHSELQSRIRTDWGFPRILEQIADTHQKDGYPDVVVAALGSRYQLMQMLSMRDPLDARYINDSHSIPYWLRTTANLPTSVGGTGETQRMGLSPQPGFSPYQVEDWKRGFYRGTPSVGRGPGTAFVVPVSQASD